MPVSTENTWNNTIAMAIATMDMLMIVSLSKDFICSVFSILVCQSGEGVPPAASGGSSNTFVSRAKTGLAGLPVFLSFGLMYRWNVARLLKFDKPREALKNQCTNNCEYIQIDPS
jgi:hypothetical protein